jgi:hypothetical protein
MLLNLFDRIRYGWTFTRALYLIAGIFFITNAFVEKQWAMSLFGFYFAAMGLFRFGCAAGACAVPPASRASEPTEAGKEI